MRADDGYAANLPLALVDDCLLVYAVGNAPLCRELGGPDRFLTRGADRCRNVKRVVAIDFSEAAIDVDHRCAHAIARATGDLLVAPGRPS